MLEANELDVVFEDGETGAVGTDRRMSLSAVAPFNVATTKRLACSAPASLDPAAYVCQTLLAGMAPW